MRRGIAGILAGALLVSPFYANSPFAAPSGTVDVTVDSSSTLVTGGTFDWIGRPSIKRRSDGVLLMVYVRMTGHAENDGGIYLKFSDDDGVTWTAENTKLASDGGGAVSGFPLNPTAGTNEVAFEPWLVATPTADEFLLHTWAYNHAVSMDGTHQWRTTDGGLTWSYEGGPLAWAGLTSGQNQRTFATDQDVVVGSTIFVGARVFASSSEATQDPVAVVFCSTTDEGATYTRLATLVSSAALSGHGTQEIGFTRVGSRFLGIIREVSAITHTYAMWSTDLSGTSWGSLEDWTAELGVMGRGRLYTRAQLKGEANWWNDPVLILTGFEHTTPGSSLPRRNSIWVSRDSGTTWDGPFAIDTLDVDAGYSDIFYRSATDRYVVVSYKGASQNAADLIQYVLDIDGI
jgi:hypothetical protein